jgi:hypothetical protein
MITNSFHFSRQMQAGFRHVTKTMVIDGMEALARILRRHLELHNWKPWQSYLPARNRRYDETGGARRDT